ncbi:hypothetical protein N7510_007612 [Penicillium lagena]|uniref:uncharacterized protein n=1 Tax=Penicillium lagena TaxID=94218 RepID=UPI002541BA1E|nr:uncharacterized protein N7510_007612 [Penicillium lagena]KAJ5610893.1 hypothetical protein N7510_007612 [Penicillium lagena]
MPKQAWKSDTCITCRRRKVKCDGLRPRCGKCTKHGVSCDGYQGDYGQLTRSASSAQSQKLLDYVKTTRMLQTALAISSPHAGKQYHCQLLARFMTLYMPNELIPAHVAQQTACLWYKDLPDSLGRSDLYDQALVALSMLIIGQSEGNEQLSTESLRRYSEVSQNMANDDITKNLSLNDQLGIAMTMTIYEVHYSCAGREATTLSKPEWLAISHDSDSYDTLLDIILQIPRLSQQMSKHIKQRGGGLIRDDETLRQTCHELRRLEAQLLYWYWDLQASHDAVMFCLDQSLPSDAPFVAGDTSQIVRFVDRPSFELHIMFWIGCMSLYMLGAEIRWPLNDENPGYGPFVSMEDIAHPNPDIPQIAHSINKGGIRSAMESDYLARHFADRVCQSVAMCMRTGFPMCGLQAMLPPLWFASQAFERSAREKAEWCQLVLGCINVRGMKLAEVVRNISQDQFVAMRSINYQTASG